MNPKLKDVINAFNKSSKHTFFKDVRINMRFCSKKSLYDKGYKYCSNENYMVLTDADICPLCGRIFRTHLINRTCIKNNVIFSEPIIPITIIKNKGVINK